jgi:TctA family transporter
MPPEAAQVDVWYAFYSSLFQILEWPTIGYMFVGMFIGFWVGILPGIGGAATMALMLPFVFSMTPVAAIAFLLGMYSVTATTGDITSVLFGVPGEGSSAAVIFDGFPMAKRGEAGRALGVVLFTSLVGAIIGAIGLAMVIPFVRPIVLSFGPPEFFMMGVLGLSFVAALSGGSLVKGLLMAGFGLILATVGQDPGTARLRYTFGEPYLFQGVPLIPVAVGLFAVPSIVEMMWQKTAIARVKPTEVHGAMQGVKDTFTHWWLTVRASLIGLVLAMIPGVGGGTSQFIAYAHAYQTSKNKERFGNGSIEGLVAAGAVNNSREGGHLIPTVAFGIPAGASMALLLGALLIVGITPGPAMLTTNLDVTFSMVWTMVVTNIITTIFCLIFVKQLAWITFAKGSVLVPYLIFLVAIGAFTANNAWLDIVLMLGFGVLGMLMTIWRWPIPPLLLGLVLGDLAERNYFLSQSLFPNYEWLSRPLVIVLAIISLLGLLGPVIGDYLKKRGALRAIAGEADVVTH